jgi:small subunit ribosomal protein S17|tara:strand:- start:806 stop:1168 length:363 start_codon:yes stop_codon:yes gene_type:complete
MDRTAVVEMVWKKRSRLYRKQVRQLARFMVHDPENKCLVGDTVRIEETRPISKSKHWRLMEILSRRQVADVRAIDLESDAVMVTTAEEPQDAEEAADDAAEQDDEQDTEDESSSDEQDAE